MAVQWLRLCTSNAGGVGSNLVGELLIRSHMLYGMVPSPNNHRHHQKKKKHPQNKLKIYGLQQQQF